MSTSAEEMGGSTDTGEEGTVDSAPLASEQETDSGESVDWSGLFSRDEDSEPVGVSEAEEGTEGSSDSDSGSEGEGSQSSESETPAGEDDASQPAGTETEEAEAPERTEDADAAQAEEPEAQPSEEQQPQAEEQGQEQPTQSWDDLREQAKEQLKKQYELTEAEKQQYDENPAETLSQLAANLHVQVFDAVYNNLMQQLPQVVRQVHQHDESKNKFDSEFNKTWPKLKGQTQVVNQMIDTIRRLKPEISEADLIQQAGAQASLLLNLPPEPAGQAGGGNSQPQAKSQAPAQPEQSDQMQGGYSPAKPSGAAQSLPTGQQGSVWTEFLEED